MPSKEPRKLGLAVVLVLLLSGPLYSQAVRQRERGSAPPSVLIITIDTLRADHLHCYGYGRIQTPAIDQLATEGVRFENAYAQVPITLPSHAVILTGTYPMFNGVRDFTTRGLPASIPTLADIFRRSGYETAAFVSSFAVNSIWGLNRGFEVYDDNVGVNTGQSQDLMSLERRGDETVNRLLAWLTSHASKRFFVWLHLYDPHSPYRPPEPFLAKYRDRPYDGEIAFDDAQIGRVLRRFKELGLYDSSVICLLSDHGESLGEHGEHEHGFFIYRSTLWVPLILRLPGESYKGLAVPQPVGTIDLAPTLAKLCQIPAADGRSFQGRSLVELFEKGSSEVPYGVYVESYYPRDSFGWHELRGIATSHYQFIDAPLPELYDLSRDPDQKTNLISAASATGATLRDELKESERRYASEQARDPAPRLDLETLEKLKSLGYIGYDAGAAARNENTERADPKEKIATFNQILRAGDLIREKRFSQAEQLLSVLERFEPNLYVIPFQLAENYLAWQKPAQAVTEFRKSLSLNPTFDQAALGLGRAHFFLGEDAKAAAAIKFAVQLNPDNYLARVALAKVYWRQNSLEKAESELKEVLRSHPDFGEAHVDYGIILAKQRNYRQALIEIRRGFGLGYQDAIAYNYFGVSLAETGDVRGAIRAYEKAVTLDPRYAAAYLNLALVFRRQGEVARAQTFYRKACDLSDTLCREYASQFSR
jgi:arylsulfatase A-like enzyme/tetratricopeptide (TPR) repeat protein